MFYGGGELSALAMKALVVAILKNVAELIFEFLEDFPARRTIIAMPGNGIVEGEAHHDSRFVFSRLLKIAESHLNVSTCHFFSCYFEA